MSYIDDFAYLDTDADFRDRDPLDDKADYDIHEEMELDRDMAAGEFDLDPQCLINEGEYDCFESFGD